MGYTWTTQPSGLVLVDQGQGLKAPMFGAGRNSRRVARWTSIAQSASAAYDVPIEWILGVIWAESAGRPDAISPAGAVGLMQVMPKMHGTTKQAMLDPRENIHKGTGILAHLRSLTDEEGRPFDLPRSASGYNAGLSVAGPKPLPHPSTSSPWGMREETPYILNVVSAQNHWRENPPEAPGGALPVALAFSVIVGAAAAVWHTRDRS
jgi:soluble lytic murein transglycosylase-like protein